ncbi:MULTISPECIES: type I-F CRISPR-associated helicase Cas3f [unclassified Pseudomonas]|uniref:type I-F CRISPR-associated helicase Cas3f n=1 Tax=unclassified Pseudomonas TaxID=196821 RepID=UPI00244CFA9B|nr:MULTISPECIES: type I-F CRISPR-associated helicase Cas3f [unclassified Pseudomonas]MDH0897416.1 type I-F CRISPR-associated helicase Cas3f [Pseudomonas sp. GD03875]MDH1065122.1 type I-F CRISPR-associated helicase Cas3f [Pseudomonas sp. GD03985]
MNVLLISQCDKRALVESRRILDQFAERRGERTWQTPITQAGLDTLRKLLKKTARRNTAVACHWIRGKDHSELLWIVGDASRFNEQGAVPTNTTRRDVLRKDDENDWHTGEDIKLLAQMAALLHDLGKASVAFQQRLRQRTLEKNLYRHEWVSLRLFLAFVGTDDDATWLRRLAEPDAQDDASWLVEGRYQRDGLDAEAPPPFKGLPPLAAAIAWLVLTHHRLPVIPVNDVVSGQQQWLGRKSSTFNPAQLPDLLDRVEHDWNELRQSAGADDIAPYWQFAHDLPVLLPKWRTQAAKLATRLQALCAKAGKGVWLNNPYVMHLARLSLMLADHHYSSLSADSAERVRGDGTSPLYANTDQEGRLKQPLDEHLLGVARLAGGIVHGLSGFERHLPRLARHRGLKKRSENERFRWQDKAADAAVALREQAAGQGAFIINMASTGCGKTLANARVLYNLAEPRHGLRATFALGLRTLTLQTGRSYREDLHLSDDELAIHVGGSASRALFEYHQARAESSGSASIQQLLEEDSHVLYEGQPADHPLLSRAMHDERIRNLLYAPMLVCTIDHLMPATEAQRAGRQIAPMLRLMSSDLVLDELDDFDLADLPALTRLVHWAGLLGSRVLLSSATLPPALVDGMFQAYRAGRLHYRRNRGQHGGQDGPLDIPCLWLDEFGVQQMACSDAQGFASGHEAFVHKRVQALARLTEREGTIRGGELVPLRMEAQQEQAVRRAFAAEVRAAAVEAHGRHGQACPRSGKRVSFGLVRMANIEPLFEVAQELLRLGAPEDHRIHLCVYHSRFPLLLRSAIEQRLDTSLDRRKPEAIYERAEIRRAIDASPERNHLFVVLGSPVTEVGRDHDYDWAVVEPSSMRSLIQLAGRVQRHRNQPCRTPNILIFDTNLRHFSSARGRDGQPLAAFVRPGFEDEHALADAPFRLTSHRLGKLLRADEYHTIGATPRIQPRPEQERQPKRSLVDLEHARMAERMLPKPRNAPPAASRFAKPADFDLDAACAWQFPRAALTWALPQQQPFRDDPGRETELLFLPDEDQERLLIHRIHEQAQRGKPAIYTTAESQVEHLCLAFGPRIGPWGQDDLLELLLEQAQAQRLPLEKCAQRFTTVSVPQSEQGWRYHPLLGFSKKS